MSLLHPESDLSMSVLAMGASVIQALIECQRPVLVDDLQKIFVRHDYRRTYASFVATLEFLFVLGVINHVGYRISLALPSSGKTGDLFDGMR